MRAAAVLLTVTLAAGGCFPTNPKARTYAKLGEGGAILAGIGLLAAVNSGADCAPVPGRIGVQECHEKATRLGDVGLGLILVGMVGFLATISTADDDKKPETAALPTAPTAPTAVAVPALPGKKSASSTPVE